MSEPSKGRIFLQGVGLGIEGMRFRASWAAGVWKLTPRGTAEYYVPSNTHRLHSSSFWGLPYRVPKYEPQKETIMCPAI